MRQLCISFQDWTGTALNRSIQGLIDHVGIGNVSTEHLLEQLKATLQLSQSVATAWSDGATLDCAVAYNILLHQRDQVLWGVSSLGSQDEWERLRTAPFGASSLLDELPNKLQLWDKVDSRQRDNALYRGSAPFAVGKHMLLHIDQHRLHPCHDGMLLCRCRPHVHIPFWPVGDVIHFRQPGERRHRSWLPVSQDLGTGQPNCCTTFDHRPSRQTTTSGLVIFSVYKKGGNSFVPVLWCLETKDMQQVDVRCSGSRFPSSVPSAPPWLVTHLHL